MGLYERIIGRDDDGLPVEDRIVPEVLAACISEQARELLDADGVRELLAALAGAFATVLTDDEFTEFQTLLATIDAEPSAALKLSRYLEIRDVLFLARIQAAGYSLPSEVRTRLGV